jgi:mono/diheme cytochrome c family protein
MPKARTLRYVSAALGVALLLAALGWMTARAQTPDPLKLKRGAALFAENCVVCHGERGQGRVGATLAKDWPSIRPDLTVKSTIANGVQGSPMPAWGKARGGPLSDDDIDALTVYILSWQTGGPNDLPPLPTFTPHPPIAPVPNVQGDPNQGAVLFGQNCVVCHGKYGEGKIGALLVKEWPSLRPDLTIKSTISNGVQGSLMPAWSNARGGPLSEQQINHLTAYVLSLTPKASTPAIDATPPPSGSSFFQGWVGVATLIILFAVIVILAVLFQRKPQN